MNNTFPSLCNDDDGCTCSLDAKGLERDRGLLDPPRLVGPPTRRGCCRLCCRPGLLQPFGQRLPFLLGEALDKGLCGGRALGGEEVEDLIGRHGEGARGLVRGGRPHRQGLVQQREGQGTHCYGLGLVVCGKGVEAHPEELEALHGEGEVGLSVSAGRDRRDGRGRRIRCRGGEAGHEPGHPVGVCQALRHVLVPNLEHQAPQLWRRLGAQALVE
mmetsp:Transcript_10084/g.34832  ORF Transcript_10084/g.34832 Transcript_10084/m.34832 type:complete len:215 (+) Transcript_10084:2985-3629(+)